MSRNSYEKNKRKKKRQKTIRNRYLNKTKGMEVTPELFWALAMTREHPDYPIPQEIKDYIYEYFKNQGCTLNIASSNPQ